MNNNFLSQKLSSFLNQPTQVNYLSPIAQNLSAGVYKSEILDVQKANSQDENSSDLDFYHKLTPQSGEVQYFRFRYYEKELPGLAESLSRYGGIETWKDTIGLEEDVEIAPKPNSAKYMAIVYRQKVKSDVLSNVDSGTPPIINRKKTGGLSVRSRSLSANKQNTHRQSLLDEDDFEDFDFDEEY